MKKIVSYLRQASWILWTVVAGVVGVLIWTLRSLFNGPKTEGPTRLPPVPDKLREHVDRVEEAALKAKVEASVRAEDSRQDLENIAKIPDGAERRKRLAAKLRRVP